MKVAFDFEFYTIFFVLSPTFSSRRVSRDRIVVSTSRCGRDNPGSNPGHGRAAVKHLIMASRQIFCSKLAFFKEI